MEEASLNLSVSSNALQLLDSSVPAALNLINSTEKTTNPVIKAYDGNLEMETGKKVIKDKEITDINKTIILIGLMAEPEDKMFTPTSAIAYSYEDYDLGQGWRGIADEIFDHDLLGNEVDNDQYRKLANAVVYSLAAQSNQGFKKTPMVHGESPYATLQAETQALARLFPQISGGLFPNGMNEDSVLEAKGKYHFNMTNGQPFVRD